MDELPGTVDETYEHILQDIPDAKWECTHLLLQCVLVARRPLLVEELAEFLAFDFKAGPIPKFRAGWRPEDPEDGLLSTCSGLLSVVEADGSRIAQFSHASVKEFLTSNRIAIRGDHISRYRLFMTPAQTIVARSCLSALADQVNVDNSESFPLADYAARYWLDHVLFENVSQNTQDCMKLFFDPSKPYFAAWASRYGPDEFRSPHPRSESSSPPGGTPLHYATLYGLYGVVEFLVTERPQDINALGTSHNQTPLIVACNMGHLEVMHLLLQLGADPNAQDGSCRTALHWASKSGRLEVAQLLLKNGASQFAQDDNGEISLHLASRAGHLELVRLLSFCLCTNNKGRTPDEEASTSGHYGIAQLLRRERARYGI